MGGETNGDTSKHVEEQAQAEIWKYVFGYVDIAVVKCAIELGIADVLESNNGEPTTLSHLSSVLGCSQSFLYRIMRFLVHRRIFDEIKTSQEGHVGFVETPISRLLTKKRRKKHGGLDTAGEQPSDVGAMACAEQARTELDNDNRMRVVANGRPAFECVHDNDVWGYAKDNPSHGKLIDDAMACDARLAVPAVVEGCRELFEGVGTVVDVGGGNGTAMGILVKLFPWMKCINFDLPHVVSGAPDYSGVEHVGGDMFDVVPKADVAFLMWVLHDWGDDECINILKKCREAIPSDKGKVIIVEAVISDDDNNNDNQEKDELEYVRLMLDMVMMAHTNNGKERTIKEWDHVLCQAGFSRHIIKPIRAVQSVIVAFP